MRRRRKQMNFSFNWILPLTSFFFRERESICEKFTSPVSTESLTVDDVDLSLCADGVTLLFKMASRDLAQSNLNFIIVSTSCRSDTDSPTTFRISSMQDNRHAWSSSFKIGIWKFWKRNPFSMIRGEPIFGRIPNEPLNHGGFSNANDQPLLRLRLLLQCHDCSLWTMKRFVDLWRDRRSIVEHLLAKCTHPCRPLSGRTRRRSHRTLNKERKISVNTRRWGHNQLGLRTIAVVHCANDSMSRHFTVYLWAFVSIPNRDQSTEMSRYFSEFFFPNEIAFARTANTQNTSNFERSKRCDDNNMRRMKL